MGSDPQYARFPNLNLSQDIFNLSNPSCPKPTRQGSLQKLQDAISEHKMAPLYRHLAHPTEGILNSAGEGAPQGPSRRPSTVSALLAPSKAPSDFTFPWDEKLYDKLVEDNEKTLEGFKKEEEEAAEQAGDTEVLAAQGKRAEFWAEVGDKVLYVFACA